MRVVTSVTIFNDAVGMRMSITYSDIDENTGRILLDNSRIDRVVTDQDVKTTANSLLEQAQTFVENA